VTFSHQSDRTEESSMIITSLAGRRFASEARPRPGALRALFTRLAAWWDERRRIARTIDELEQLSDHELADIGITRADIVRVARGSVRREM
jgi:uncharacterized protein YjiS (DUF1127 family)